MSRTYTAEPAPSGLDPVLSEYLMRQLHAISASTKTMFSPPRVVELPDRLAEGAIVHLKSADATQNGLWACAYNGAGELEWKKVQLIDN